MKNIHILPTDKPSRLIIYSTLLNEFRLLDEPIEDWKHKKNIYITNDEYIGLSYYLDGNLIRKGVVDDKDYWEVRKDYKKIILTTDAELIADGVQTIDDEFLEWFVKNPSCEFVETKLIKDSEDHPEICGDYKEEWEYYKIILPKEEPTSCACGANTSCQCEEPKEKTFEEILSKMTLVNPKHLRMTSNGHGEFPDGYMLTEDGVKYIVKQLKNK